MARRPCTLTLAPARRRLRDNDLSGDAMQRLEDTGLGDDARQAIRAAARSGLQLFL